MTRIWRTRVTCFKDTHKLEQNVCPYLHVQHEQIMSPHRRGHTYCFSRISSSYSTSSYFTQGPSLPWSYGSWFYNYLCNQYLSVLWIRISVMAKCTTLCDKVCQWLPTGRWFSSRPPVSSTNKTDLHDITEIFLKVALSTIKQINKQKHVFTKSCSGCYLFIFWHRRMIFGMKLCEHQPVCDVSSRLSSNHWHQGQIINFWGHFCVRDVVFFIFWHRFMIFDMKVCYHQAVCPISACSSLDLDLRPQSQDIP